MVSSILTFGCFSRRVIARKCTWFIFIRVKLNVSVFYPFTTFVLQPPGTEIVETHRNGINRKNTKEISETLPIYEIFFVLRI